MASFCIKARLTSLEQHNVLAFAPTSQPRRSPLVKHASHRVVSQRALNGREHDIQLGWPGVDRFYPEQADLNTPTASSDDPAAAAAAASTKKPGRVLGLGQAMNDIALESDDLLEELGVLKGSRKVITVEERAALLERLEGRTYQVSAGGSLSNTLMALARLGASSPDRRPLSVAMAGLVGSDPLGAFYSAQMQAAGVEVLAEPVDGAATGTVVVLTGSDAQRTMLSYLGTPAAVEIDPRIEAAIAESALLCIEGYLWELPDARKTIGAAVDAARRHGTAVALTAGDAGVVERHHEEMWDILSTGTVDILFANASEAALLVSHAPPGAVTAMQATTPAEACAMALGSHCSLACVTDGSAGSAIAALGELQVIPPHWTKSQPVDSCGAGDAYAAGFLYGYVRGYDVINMGRAAARTASAVIAYHGAVLTEDAAAAVAAGLPAAAEKNSFSSAKGPVDGAMSAPHQV